MTYKGYIWKCFFFKHNFKSRNTNDLLCKLYLSTPDDPQHLFFHYPISQQLISDLEPFLTSALKQPSTLTQKTLLFNYTKTTGTPHIITTKSASLIRLSLYNLRTYNTFLYTPIPTFSLIEEKFKINTKFKGFLDHFFLDKIM